MQPIQQSIRLVAEAPGIARAPGGPLVNCHETVTELFAYWHLKRGSRAMPARADIDPVDLKRLLPLLCLIDVVPDARRYVYRLVGTRDVEMRGFDPTGKSVAEGSYAESPGETERYLDQVVTACQPLIYRGTYRPFDTRIETDEVLFLPLSTDGTSVEMVLLYSHTLWIKDEGHAAIRA